MTTHGSVTGWLKELRSGDAQVAQKLWEEYFGRLVGLARARLAGKPRTLDDPEDVALSAFNSFCTAAKKGRFPRLNDRRDLWQVLFMLTDRKAINAVRREQAAIRPGELADAQVMENLPGTDPTPSRAHQFADECRRLLAVLPDELRTIALLKLEEYTNAELAALLPCSLATVERKLALIRRYWEKEGRRG